MFIWPNLTIMRGYYEIIFIQSRAQQLFAWLRIPYIS